MNAEIVEIPMIPKQYAANIRRGIPAIGPEEFITYFKMLKWYLPIRIMD